MNPLSPDTFKWVSAAHVLGFILWTGGLLACLQLLRVHHQAGDDGRSALSGIQRKTALFADIGALVAIAAGLLLAFGQVPNAFRTGGWLHGKLLVVLGILVIHVLIRRGIRKFRTEGPRPVSGILLPALLVAIAAVVVLARVKPF